MARLPVNDAGIWLLILAAAIWITGHTTAASVRARITLNSLEAPPRKKENALSRYPLRVAGSIVGALTALVSGLVGSGLLTTGQGDATTGVVTAVIALLAAFGVVVSAEHKVTPLVDPRDPAGRPLTPEIEDERVPEQRSRA